MPPPAARGLKQKGIRWNRRVQDETEDEQIERRGTRWNGEGSDGTGVGAYDGTEGHKIDRRTTR